MTGRNQRDETAEKRAHGPDIGWSRTTVKRSTWPPTILTGVPKDAKVLHDEPFGPILTVAPFDTIEEAIEESNATEYGLAAYFLTGAADTKRALIVGLSAGAISVNYLKGVCRDAPYGGVKQSGYGYEGEQGLRSFQSLKLVNGFASFG
ncbi:aldehyde dehydrogenase family protein [Mesorhizobium sp. M0816]